MQNPIRAYTLAALSFAAVLALIALFTPAYSAGSAFDPAYQKECGACHTPYPAQFLPKRSWEHLLSGLDKHFGENASLPPKSLASIKTYLESHAADSALGYAKAMRDVPSTATTLRITEMPFWTKIHARQIERHAFSAPKIKSASNCVACHRGATNGIYEDD